MNKATVLTCQAIHNFKSPSKHHFVCVFSCGIPWNLSEETCDRIKVSEIRCSLCHENKISALYWQAKTAICINELVNWTCVCPSRMEATSVARTSFMMDCLIYTKNIISVLQRYSQLQGNFHGHLQFARGGQSSGAGSVESEQGSCGIIHAGSREWASVLADIWKELLSVLNEGIFFDFWPFHSQDQKVQSPKLLKRKCISAVVRIGGIIIFHLSKLCMKSQFRDTVWCNISWLRAKFEIYHFNPKNPPWKVQSLENCPLIEIGW